MALQVYRLTVLSPVHVGNGTVLSPSLEVVYEGDSSVILDVEAAIRAYPDFFSSFEGRAPQPNELLAYLRRRGGEGMTRVVRPRIQARDIRVQLRDGRGALLLPGSTMKGAMRTAILQAVADARTVRDVVQRFDAKKPKAAARDLERRLRGSLGGPHDDWLRALCVTDAVFDAKSLDIVQVRIRSPRGDRLDREEDYWLACEAIRAGSQGLVRLSFDDFLTTRASRERLGWPQDIPFTHDWLAAVCRRHVLAHLQTEADYFHTRSPLPEVRRWIEELRRLIEQAPPDAVFLRLGYGIGWCGTTGELADPAARLDILTRCRVAGQPVGLLPASEYDARSRTFPKTRRYLRSDMDHPLFGFVRLDPVEPACWPTRPDSDPIRFAQPVARPGSATPGTAAAPARPRFAIEAMLAAVRPRDVKGRFDGLLRQVEAIEDAQERAAGLRALAALVRQSVPPRDRAFYAREDVKRCLDHAAEAERE